MSPPTAWSSDAPRVHPARVIAAIALGGATWLAVLRGSMFLLQQAWPEYAAAHPERAYTLAMLWVRLAIFAATTALTAAVATRVARVAWMPWVAGALLFLASVPDHLYPGFVWDEFPVWYHLSYLAYLFPVAWLAGQLAKTDTTGA